MLQFKAKNSCRLDHFLREKLPGFSLTAVRALLQEGKILHNGRPGCKGDNLSPGDLVEWPGAPDLSRLPHPEAELACHLRHEEPSWLVVEKSAGLHTLCNSPLDRGTLVNWLAAHFPASVNVGAHPLEFGVVHRLDQKTSGLLLVAKEQSAYSKLRHQMQRRQIKKTYLALVQGRLTQDGEIALPLTRLKKDIKRLGVFSPDIKGVRGKPLEAITRYRVEKKFSNHSLLEIELITGVQHQIRLHLAHLGHPIVGEDLYAAAQTPPQPFQAQRYFLHAAGLAFKDPVSGEEKSFSSGLPAELKGYLKQLQ